MSSSRFGLYFTYALLALSGVKWTSHAFSSISKVVSMTRSAPFSGVHHDGLSFQYSPIGSSSSPKMTAIWQQQQQPTTQFSSRSSLTRLRTALEAEVPKPQSDLGTKLRKYASRFCNCFPIWILMTALVALARPATFLSIPSSTFPAQIGLLMLCMGISLQPRDFKRVAQRPGAVLLAFVGCYGVMPALAYGIGKALALSPSLAAGLVLVACINGAQASNLCTYIGQGDLALSVLMTTMTTIGAIVFTRKYSVFFVLVLVYELCL